VSRFGDAAFTWMRSHKRSSVTSNELWKGLETEWPEITTKTATRKTPRTTCMRDLRKDPRFRVGKGKIAIADEA